VGQGGGRSECAATFRAAEERKGVGRATLGPVRGRGSSYLCDDDDVGCLGIGLGAGAWKGERSIVAKGVLFFLFFVLGNWAGRGGRGGDENKQNDL
jgi:hypothetical protein